MAKYRYFQFTSYIYRMHVDLLYKSNALVLRPISKLIFLVNLSFIIGSEFNVEIDGLSF